MSKKKAQEVKRLDERILWLERPTWPCAIPGRDADLDQSERNEIAKAQQYVAARLGWSKKRLASFQKLFAEYQISSSITTYLKIRRAFPEVEICTHRFLTHSIVFESAFEHDLKRLRIDTYLIRRLYYGPDEPALDALCLRLLELLVERDALPRNGPHHIDQRRTAISDAFLNYVISIILECLLKHSESVRIPDSLVLLIRRQLCGETPDLYEAEIAFLKQIYGAQTIADALSDGEELTVRKAAKLLNISRSTAARWLASTRFRTFLEEELNVRGISNAGAEPGRTGVPSMAPKRPSKKYVRDGRVPARRSAASKDVGGLSHEETTSSQGANGRSQ